VAIAVTAPVNVAGVAIKRAGLCSVPPAISVLVMAIECNLEPKCNFHIIWACFSTMIAAPSLAVHRMSVSKEVFKPTRTGFCGERLIKPIERNVNLLKWQFAFRPLDCSFHRSTRRACTDDIFDRIWLCYNIARQ
jgi:hypothetical protein